MKRSQVSATRLTLSNKSALISGEEVPESYNRLLRSLGDGRSVRVYVETKFQPLEEGAIDQYMWSFDTYSEEMLHTKKHAVMHRYLSLIDASSYTSRF